MAALTYERAVELAKIGGFVRLPRRGSAQHRNSARVEAVLSRTTIRVRPQHHRGTDDVPIESCSEHRSKTAIYQERAMERVRDANSGRETTIADALMMSAGRSDSKVLIGPPTREPFVVIDTINRRVWGGPEGKNRGFHVSIDKAATYSDSASAARSIGKLRHAKEWKSSINVDALTPMPKSAALKMLANRQSSTSQSLFGAAPMVVEATAPPVHINGHAPKPAMAVEIKPPVEVKPPLKVEPPRLPDPPVVPNPPMTTETQQNIMELVASLAHDYKDFQVAIEMAQEAQRNIMRKVGLIQSSMSGQVAALKG